ncbi:hypothetical protein [Halobellus clavatus]|mgnify:CR=1 FL=1|jgi:hypothetical protein|uniref:Uncharacterized protein n=1 Tax=Halobellus clavatus TaxID=660517 RepID=A0A1H3EGZ2_9EURY|nr:hypothetical protein [Halobellus clavatus]SDX78012.1 hypothetical protein SAMN04487946_102282 [Halobellus clavatus]
MSHERGPTVPRGEETPPNPEHRVLTRLKRHFLEWADRYVEMRVRARRE